MNIENHFNNVKAYLEMANEKVSAQDYDSALASLAKACTDIRELIDHVYSLKRLKSEFAHPAEDSDKDLREKHQWLQSQGGISSEGFGR